MGGCTLSGADKREAWERLLTENKLGALTLLRNLRNMAEAKVSESLVKDGLARMKAERVLPFRFLAAARYAPQWESELEQAMFRALKAGQAAGENGADGGRLRLHGRATVSSF